jgi:hypothetical protein
MTTEPQTYTLIDANGRTYPSPTPGSLGGHRRNKLYGRLDCSSALRAIAAGGYITQRVFFADEQTAVAGGYRPCAVCLPEAYQRWKAHYAATSEVVSTCAKWSASHNSGQ